MGAWYESFLVKTEKPEALRQTLGHLAKESDRRFYIGPAIDGWISIFPNNYGSNEDVATTIAENLRADMFHFMVSDDDVFIYLFYRGGMLIDRYNSCPDHFGEVSNDEKKGCVGRPDLFRDLFASEDKFSDFVSLLSANEEYVFEQERMSAALDLLGLSNALSSYEYLREGERDSIRSWREFVHVPDLSDEKKAKQAARAQLKAEKKRLQKERVLLAEIAPPKRSTQRLPCSIAWGTDYSTGGILLTMQNHQFTKAVNDSECAAEICSLAPPWNRSVEPAGLRTNWTIYIFSMSPSGDWLAGGYAFGDWALRVWDWRRKTLEFEVSHTRAVQWVAFSYDSQWLYSLGGEEFVVTSMAERRPIATIGGMGGARSAAVHPSGKFAVIAFQDRLEIIDLDRKEVINRLWVNRGMETFDPFADNPDALVAVCMKEFLEHQKIREKFGITPELRTALLKDLKAIEQLNPQAQQNLHSMIEDVRQKSCRTFETKEQPFDVQFHPNGEQLFVTTKGLRVFDWRAILAATGDAPPPLLSIDAPRDDETDPNSRPLAYCVRFDPQRNLLLSSCLAGVVQYLNLATSKSGVLLKAPGELSIWRLELTSDKQALCCHCTTRPRVRPRSEAFTCLQVWNYPALCHSAGIE